MLFTLLLQSMCAVSGFAEVRQVLDFNAFTRDKAQITGVAAVSCPASGCSRDSLVSNIGLLVFSLPRDSLFTEVGEFDGVKANRALQEKLNGSGNYGCLSSCSLTVMGLNLAPELVAALYNRQRAGENYRDKHNERRVQQQSLEQQEQKEVDDFLRMSSDNRRRYLADRENQLKNIELRMDDLKKEHFSDSTYATIIALEKGYMYAVKRVELLRKLLDQ